MVICDVGMKAKEALKVVLEALPANSPEELGADCVISSTADIVTEA